MLRQVRRKLLVLATALPLALAAAGAGADQNDPALDGLFEALARAAEPHRISEIEARIWHHWYSSGSPAVDRLFHRGNAALAAGQFRFAHAIFNEIVERRPDLSEGWNRRATARYLMGDYEGSIRDIDETLKRESRHFGALSGLGLCRLALGHESEALEAFEAALRLHPHMPSVKRHVERLRIEIYGPVTRVPPQGGGGTV